MTILIRTEADPKVGLGHLQRSLSLAAALRRCGIRPYFLVNDRSENLQRLKEFGLEGEAVQSDPSETAWTLEKARALGALGIGVDLSDLPAALLPALQEAGLWAMVRDDLGGRDFPCSLLVNGNADALALSYGNSNGRTRFLLGPKYGVLQTDFWKPQKRQVRTEVQNILIILGGADPFGLMPKLIHWIDRLDGTFSITVVLGPFFEGRAEIEREAARSHRSVRIMRNPPSLAPFFWEADLAISGAGQTLYELACTGCPTVAIQVSTNQAGQLRALEKTGVLWAAGHGAQTGLWERLQAKVPALLQDAGARRAMAEAGQALVDGQGAFRVAEVIATQVSS